MKEYKIKGIEKLDEIGVEDFINYVKKVRNDEITNIAPLGISSDSYIIFENKNKPLRKEFISEKEYQESKDKEYYDKPMWHSSELSMRKYGNKCELLITDYEGKFLTYSQISFAFDDEFIGKNFYQIFIQLKPYMNKLVDTIEEKINWNKVNYSIGFDMIEKYSKKTNGGNK